MTYKNQTNFTLAKIDGGLLPRQNGKTERRAEWLKSIVQDIERRMLPSNYKAVYVAPNNRVATDLRKQYEGDDNIDDEIPYSPLSSIFGFRRDSINSSRIVFTSPDRLKSDLVGVEVYDIIIDTFCLDLSTKLELDFSEDKKSNVVTIKV